MDSKSPSYRILARLVPLDAIFVVIIPVLVGYTLGLASPLDAAISTGVAVTLRLFVWGTHLRMALAPVDAFHRVPPKARTDDALRQTIATLHAVRTRFLVVYDAAWALSVLGALTWVGRYDANAGPRFYVTSLLVSETLVFGAGIYAFTNSSAAIGPVLEPLLAEAEARGISLPAPSHPIRWRVAVLAVCVALTPMGWLGGIAFRNADAAAAEQARRDAHVAALEAALYGADAVASDAAGTEVAVLADDAAAPQGLEHVARAAREADGDGSVASVRTDRAMAWVRTTDGRIALAVTTISSAPTTLALVTLMLFAIGILVWAPISAVGFGRDLGDGIGRVTAAVGRLVDVGDLSAMRALPIVAEDELGELTRHFNDLVRVLSGLASSADRVAKGELKSGTTATGELPDAFRGMLTSLRAVVGRIRETSVELASAAAEIYSASQEQEAAAAQQSASITEVSSTMTSLAESAAHIAGSVNDVLSDAERTRTTTDQMASRIAELNAHASRIGELLEVIREVADRSDLLALNGSLEATRAGEAGRGFGLVAGEMRRLAERVTATVTDVRALITDIRASGSTAVMATENSRKLAESTTDAARRIALVTQQQRTATEQVTSSVREVAGVLSQAVAATSQTRVSAEQLRQQAEQLETLLAGFVVENAKSAA